MTCQCSENEKVVRPAIQSAASTTVIEGQYIDAAQDRTKKASKMSSVLFVAGSMIGCGIFMTPNNISMGLPSPFYTLLAWVILGLISLGYGLCYAELGLLYPSCGGEYEYFSKAFNNSVGFSFAFVNFLCLKPCSIAILIMFFVRVCIDLAFPNLAGNNYIWTVRFVSVGITLLLCLLNSLSNYLSIKVNDVLTYAKFLCMGIIVSLAIYKLSLGEFENIDDWKFIPTISAHGVILAIYNGMWSYDGFNQLAYLVEDMKNPKKDLIFASIIGIGVVITLYLIINFSYIILLGIDGLSLSQDAARDSVEPYMKNFSAIVVILVSLSAFGSANATAFCGGKINLDAARKGDFPRLIAGVHRKFKTMVPSLMIQAILTSTYILLSNDCNELLNFFSGIIFITFALTTIAVFVVRFKEKNIKRDFKIPLPIVVLLIIISCTIVMAGFVIFYKDNLISLGIIVGSFIIYYFFKYFSNSFPPKLIKFSDDATDFILNGLGCDADIPTRNMRTNQT